MIRRPKIPVKISLIKSPDGHQRRLPTVPLREILHQEPESNLQEELKSYGAKYDKLIENCKEVLSVINLEKKILVRANPLLFWALGDRIISFVSDDKDSLFFINGLYEHLSRDLQLSRSSLRRVLSFRRRLQRNQVDANKPWNFYRSHGDKKA